LSDSRLGLLVIDDDDLIASGIRVSLPTHWRLTHSADPHEIPHGIFSAALVDMHLTGDLKKAEGLQLIQRLRVAHPHLEIIAMSGDLERGLMESCLKAGASRFLAKPLSAEELLLTLEKIEALELLREATFRTGSGISPWIGSSATSTDVRRKIAQLRAETGPILIEGESGSGKEVAAQLIHAQEGRKRPFVTVNVAALPENVFESEFFGHVRGAFTGADQNKMGLAEAAHGGDLFLDEIEALPSTQQAKLLRFLENGEVRRVGARDAVRVHVRVIAATNQNLETLVKENRFREDLLWRLNGRKLLLPPLRERTEDIGELANHFLERERPRRNKSIDPDAVAALTSHHWPGNVRELKRVCEQLCLYSPLPVIRQEDVLKALPASAPNPLKSSEIDLSHGAAALMAAFEARLIRMALSRTGDIDEASSILKISRSSLYKKIKDYNIEIRS
jgi:DNA-binding NtrC family response regulator